ncbi:hypothetical protein [Salipaludibacillus agaradhaerens]|uniref:hypothetical protein n=1 Tax=Salipaludibacillus agaradhaerens TaxID=76935 RepID=UPI000998AA84|nr:hypothetical protein [Salipaludibacillus agaradhaerens]
MAKNRGNTDFNLTATKTGTKSLRIKWSRSTNQEKVLTVQRAGDGKTIYTKTYTSKQNSGNVTIQCPYFGEYKVSIKTSRGHQHDHIFRWVRLSGSKTSTKTYTKSDIDKIKKGKLILNLVLIGTGLTGRIAFTVAATTIAISQAVREYYTYDTEWDKLPSPRAGQKIRLKIEHTKDNKLKYTWTALTEKNAKIATKTITRSYIAYPK